MIRLALMLIALSLPLTARAEVFVPDPRSGTLYSQRDTYCGAVLEQLLSSREVLALINRLATRDGLFPIFVQRDFALPSDYELLFSNERRDEPLSETPRGARVR